LNKDLAILVLSCDRYSDLWPPFFHCFRKNFPVDEWKVYVGSNTKVCNEHGVVTILSGQDVDWSSSCKRILSQIPERKIFIILEDLFAASSVDKKLFLNAIDFLFIKNANHIRYWAEMPLDSQTENPYIGKFDRGAPYRATVCGFWDREYLMGLLIEGESPWDFEILGSYRTSYTDGFYGLHRPLFEFKNMVEKGAWIPQSVEWAQAQNIPINLGARSQLKGRSQIISRLQMFYFNLLMRIPWKSRVALMHKLRKLFISY